MSDELTFETGCGDTRVQIDVPIVDEEEAPEGFANRHGVKAECKNCGEWHDFWLTEEAKEKLWGQAG